MPGWPAIAGRPVAPSAAPECRMGPDARRAESALYQKPARRQTARSDRVVRDGPMNAFLESSQTHFTGGSEALQTGGSNAGRAAAYTSKFYSDLQTFTQRQRQLVIGYRVPV